jgi:chromosome segregation ATPase
MDRLESENSNLKNKINDLDRLVFEYDEKYNDIKSKEQSLESQNKHLENELDRMAEELNEARTNANNASFQNNYSENNSNNEMHSQKLLAIEQANRILEEELETLKEQQKSERAKVKEKMELLNHKQSDRIKKLEEENKILEEKLVDRKLDESSTIHLFQKQCEDLRKRIKELESFEAENMELQNTMNKLKNELKFLQNLNSDEKKRLENEKRKLEDINSLNEKLNETIKNEARNHDQEKHEFETKLKRIENVLEKKDNELSELKKLKEIDTSNFLSKLSILNDENLSLTSQLKAMSNNISQKDGEINNMSKKVGELSKENEKLQSQLKSYLNLENELVDVHMKNTEAKERIHDLEAKLGDLERRYNKDLTDSKNSNSQQIKQLKQELTDEILKYENLHTEFSLLKLEINKLNQFKIKCDYLEKELAESRANKLQKINEYEANTKKYYEAGDKLENENRLLVAQLTSMVSMKDLYKQARPFYK